MITSPRRSVFRLPVTRHFEFTRHRDQSIALAYQTLIPVLSRRVEGPHSRHGDKEPAVTTNQRFRTRAGGA
jgi:hypothetical protein